MRRKALASVLAVAALSITAAPAFADPDFGPGNSNKGPHDGGAKCHPPGQTVDARAASKEQRRGGSTRVATGDHTGRDRLGG